MSKGAWSSWILALTLLSGTISANTFDFEKPWDHSFLYDANPENGWEWSAGGAYLFFRAREDGLNLAQTNDLGFPGAANIPQLPQSGFTFTENEIYSNNLTLKPTWNNGFRVFATLLPACTDLKMRFSYSYYKTKATHTWDSGTTPNPFTTTDVNVGTFIQKNFFYGFLNDLPATPGSSILNEIKGNYYLKVQDYDLSFIYTLSYADTFFFKPYIGLRGVLIDQALYFNDVTTILSTLSFETLYQALYQKSRYYSFGLEGGVACEYVICKGMTAFGTVGVGLLYGDQKIVGTGQFVVGGTVTPSEGTVRFGQSPSVLRPVVDSCFGIKYVTPQFFNFVKGAISLAWEQHLYFKQNSFYTTIDLQNSENNNLNLGDLSTYGLVLTGELLF